VACTEFNRARWCRNNKNSSKLAWKAANKERLSAYSKAWSERNPEKRRQIEQSWKDRNPEKVAEMSGRAGAKWSRNNPGTRNAITNRRRAALLKRTPPWADMLMIRAFYETAAELSAATGIPHEVDHIIPLQADMISGLHVHDNLRIIPRSENRAKANRWQA
jgi:hypothetical protein